MDNDRERAEVALGYIQELYEAERVTREQVLPPDERKELRLVRSLPVLNELGKWMHAEGKTVLPKSQMGKAIAYSLSRWAEELSVCWLPQSRPARSNGLLAAGQLQDPSSESTKVAEVCTGKHYEYQIQQCAYLIPSKLQRQDVVGRVAMAILHYSQENTIHYSVLWETGY